MLPKFIIGVLNVDFISCLVLCLCLCAVLLLCHWKYVNSGANTIFQFRYQYQCLMAFSNQCYEHSLVVQVWYQAAQ